MESITLKEIAGYLPYDVNIQINGHVRQLTGIKKSKNESLIINYDYIVWEALGDNKKLLLYPLSMLTQEIEHNGEKIIPIIELFKIKTQVTGSDIFDYYIKDDTAVLRLKSQGIDDYDFRTFFEVDLEPNNIMFSIATETYKDDVLTEERINLCGNEMRMFQKLYEWHFDVHGLIERGLAIDKSKI